MEDEFEDTKYCEHVMKKYGTEAGTRSLQTGNVGHLNFFSGLVGYEQDVSGMQVLMTLMNLIEDSPVFLAYIWGLMGNGKTDFALLIVEVIVSVYGRENVVLASNIESWKEKDETITEYPTLVSRLEDRRGKDNDKEYVMVLDEAAQHLTGYGADVQRQAKMSKLLKLARKSDAHIVFIGQDGKDVGPAIRTLCNAKIHKESKKQATFYHDVVDREGIGEMLNLGKIPQTSMTYDTKDDADWSFDGGGGDDDIVTQDDLDELIKQHERQVMAILDVSTDMTQAEIGDIYSVSEKTVRRAKRKFEEELQDLGLIE
jgi:hypothetical protein